MRAGEPEGWYPCPSNAAVLRYWNGQAWLGAMAPASPTHVHSGWLVMGLDWPTEQTMAEAAIAVSPQLTHEYVTDAEHDRSRPWNPDVAGLLLVWQKAVAERPERVLFLSDLTDFLERHGTSWAELDVDWEAAQKDLNRRADRGAIPALWLTVSQLAHLLLCNTPRAKLTILTPGGPELLDMAEREQVRAALTTKLVEDWSAATGLPS